MRLIVVLLFILLCSPVWANPPEETARLTAERIERYYTILGPETGCRLYDPCNVLTLAHLRPVARWNGRPFTEQRHREAFEKLNRTSRSEGHHFSVDKHGRLTIRSLTALKRDTHRQAPAWITPFPKDGDFEDWDAWSKSTAQLAGRYAEEKSYGREDLTFHLIEGFLLGYPPAAVEQYMTKSDDPLHHSRAIAAYIPNSMILENGAPVFDILPEQAGDPSISARAGEWGNFLETFYALPSVRARITSPVFLQSRTALNPELYHSYHEMWWRGAKLEHCWDLPTQQLTSAQESVLLQHIEELEALIHSKAPPLVWQRACQEWLYQDGTGENFGSQPFEQWFWYGAFGFSPERERFYKAVSEVQPSLMKALLKKKLKRRQEMIDTTDRSSFWGLREAQILYRHPEFRKRFRDLSPEEQDFVRADIRTHQEADPFAHFMTEIRKAGGIEAYFQVEEKS